MTALLFLLLGAAMVAAWMGRRCMALGLFGVGLVLSAVWLKHHMTDALAIAL